MPVSRTSQLKPRHAREHAAVRPGTARPDHHLVEPEAHLEALRHEFLHAAHVSEAANRIRPAPGNGVAATSFAGEDLCLALHLGGHVRAGRHDPQRLDAHQPEEEVVAVGVFPEAVRHPLLDDEAAAEAFLDRGRQRDTAVVALRCAARDERVGDLRPGHPRPGTRACASCSPRKQPELVVPLDPDFGPVAAWALGGQRGTEARQQFKGRRSGRVPAAWKTGQIHARHSPSGDRESPFRQPAPPGDCVIRGARTCTSRARRAGWRHAAVDDSLGGHQPGASCVRLLLSSPDSSFRP